jgi:hypothetical protein
MEHDMNLSAPTMVVFLISLVIALLGVLAAAGVISILPIAPVWTVTIAYAVLAIATMIKGA